MLKQDDDDINPMLYIDKNEICNAYEMLVSPEIKTQIFYGWKTSLKVSNTNISFYASLCTDNGKHKADDIVFILNENKVVRVVPDLSVY